MTEDGRWQMNRLQNSIVRFLKYVIDLENLIILLNIGQSILHSRQVPSIAFFFFFFFFFFLQEAIESWLYILAEMDEI